MVITHASAAATGESEAVRPVVAETSKAPVKVGGLTVIAWGRAPTVAHGHTKAVSVNPHASQVEDQIMDDSVEALVQNQQLEGFITA